MAPYLTLTIITLIAEHYFPLEIIWRQLMRSGKKPVSVNYVLGVLAIFTPWAWWFLANGDANELQAVGYLALHIVCGGVTVWLCYLLDKWLDINDRLEETAEELDVSEGLRNARR